MEGRRRRGQTSLERERELLSDLSRPNSLLAARVKESRQRARKDVERAVRAEKFTELEDSELSDWERNQAIARERMRREGFV